MLIFPMLVPVEKIAYGSLVELWYNYKERMKK